MATVGESVALQMRNAAQTIMDMEADKNAFQLCLLEFIKSFEQGDKERLTAAHAKAVETLNARRL